MKVGQVPNSGNVSEQEISGRVQALKFRSVTSLIGVVQKGLFPKAFFHILAGVFLIIERFEAQQAHGLVQIHRMAGRRYLSVTLTRGDFATLEFPKNAEHRNEIEGEQMAKTIDNKLVEAKELLQGLSEEEKSKILGVAEV